MLTDLTCGHAQNAAGAASSIAAKASGQINVLNIHREPRRSLHLPSMQQEVESRITEYPYGTRTGAAKKIKL